MSGLPATPAWVQPLWDLAEEAADCIPEVGGVLEAGLKALAWLTDPASQVPTPLQEGTIGEIDKLNDPNLSATSVFNGVLSYISDPAELSAQLAGGGLADAWTTLNNYLESQTGTMADWVSRLGSLCDPSSTSFAWNTAIFALPVYTLGASAQSLVLSELMMLSPYELDPPPASLASTPYTPWLVQFCTDTAATLTDSYATCRQARLAEITDVKETVPGDGPYGPEGDYVFSYGDKAVGKTFSSSLNPFSDGGEVAALQQQVQTQHDQYYAHTGTQFDTDYSPASVVAVLTDRATTWGAQT